MSTQQSRSVKVIFLLGMLVLWATLLEAGDLVSSKGEPIQFVPIESLRVPIRTDGEVEKDLAPILGLQANPPDYYDLKNYQTSVKDQDPRGSCTTFAFIGALEAFYKRMYGVELDLSEEYFIHIVNSTRETHNPNLAFENPPSFCTETGAPGEIYSPSPPGEIVAVLQSMFVPEEKYAPYFGDIYENSAVYPNHKWSDLLQITADSSLTYYDELNNAVCNLNRTQQDIDHFEYDPRHIPLEARKNAIYGPTELLVLSQEKARDTAQLEQLIYSEHEVSLGFSYKNIDCGPANKSDPHFVYSDGNYKCKWPVQGVNEGAGGHQMLLIGYDRTNQYFLFKNSWGAGLYDFQWLPYNFVTNVPDIGYVIWNVRDPSLGPSEEAMWMGRWNMDHDGWLGDLVIRRTREYPGDLAINQGLTFFTDQGFSTGRLGSYYSQDGTGHKVRGFLDQDGNAHLYVDFGNPDLPPDTISESETLTGQHFALSMFSGNGNTYTFGNYASGITTWNDHGYGVLLSRPFISLVHTSDTFVIDRWKDSFKLYFFDGNEGDLEVTDIGPLQDGKYSVTLLYNGEPAQATIDSTATNALSLALVNLYYHTHESGIVSTLWVYGIRTSDLVGIPTEVEASDGAYTDKVRVTWSPCTGAKKYKVFRADSYYGTKTVVGSKIAYSIANTSYSDSYDDKTAVPGQGYYYWVQVVKTGGTHSDWSPSDFGYRLLSGPTGVSATDGTYTDKVQISWKAVAGEVLSYSVYRADSSDGAGKVSIGQAAPTSLSLDDTTGVPGQSYYYWVMAEGPAGPGDRSSANRGFRKLAAPTNVSASDADARLVMNKVVISWHGVQGATSYTVYRASPTIQLNPKPQSIGTTTDTNFEDKTGIPELIYSYYVKANNSYGSSDYSTPDKGHRKLAAPTGVAATDGTYSDKVKITWNKVDGATSYEVFRADDINGDKTSLGTSKTLSFSDKAATPGAFYFYWVKSRNKYGVSNYSDKWDTGNRKLPVLIGVSASDGTYSDKIRITWNAVGGAAQYTIFRSTSATQGRVCIDGSIGTTYDDTIVSPGTAYYYTSTL